MGRNNAVSVVKLLFDGRWLIDHFDGRWRIDHTPSSGGKVENILKFIAHESTKYEGFSTVYWTSDGSTPQMSWAKDLAEGAKNGIFPVNERKKRVIEYSPAYRFFESPDKVAEMELLSQHLQNLNVREIWSLGYESRDLIFSDLIQGDLVVGCAEELDVRSRLYGGPELLVFTKGNTLANRLNIFGLGGARLLDFYCLLAEDVNREFTEEDLERWLPEVPKYSDLLKIRDRKDFLNKLDDTTKARYLRNSSIFTPFLLDKVESFSNLYTNFNKKYDGVSEDILRDFSDIAARSEKKVGQIQDFLEENKKKEEAKNGTKNK